ncbi:MAG: exodeoxyribonuclease V subunit beta [Methylococcaceae bacterium]
MNTVQQTPTATPLDVLRFPLEGSHLIEASAGTGKTFTIALLYVRLVLGHGRMAPHSRGLTPPEILVVTFTEAATQELRDRIRKRLTEAAECFRQSADYGQPSPAGKDLLLDLRAEYAPEQWPLCARKLQLAAEWMDEAAVSTIHAWCYRMLREHAFDSDSLFTQQLETDQGELFAEGVRDYWRTFLAPLEAAYAREVAGWWAGPDRLESQIKNLTHYPERFGDCPAPADSLQHRHAEKSGQLQALKAPWISWVEALQTLLDTAREQKAFDGVKLNKKNYDAWLEAIRTWCNTPESEPLVLSGAALNRLSAAGLAEIWKTPSPPTHPALDELQSLLAELQALPSARLDILRHAVWWVGVRFEREQARRAQMGFNDLLNRLRDALKGPNAERLASLIRQQFPAALIDEFQDTDPVQYEIFDRVYTVATPPEHTTLILIGDPKQAIYAFRGADIYTYLHARQATTGRHHTLNVNHRSTAAMVSASNAWFARAEYRSAGSGAFLFREEGRNNPLPFVAAAAKGREDQLIIEGQSAPAMTLWWLAAKDDGNPLPRDAYYQQMAASCASEITRLLRLGQEERAGFEGGNGFRALQPADVAILVNTRAEADAIRQALGQRGVRSVYLSDHDSVYQTATAQDVLLWLKACAEPTELRRLRAAMATATLGLRWTELDRFNHDETFVETQVQRFRGYQQRWTRQGVLAMLRQLLDDFALPTRLLGSGGEKNARGGERILTDLLHLAELLQQASQQLEGEHAVIRFLAEQIADSNNSVTNDVRQIRLESDADLVKVVTVHKSKGLEYPLVFFPYAANFREIRASDLPLKWHDAEGQLHLQLTSSDEGVNQADRERLGEDIRKFYVVLTRAKYATWVGLAPIKDLHTAAPGYLLNGGAFIASAALESHLNSLAEACPHIHVSPAPQPTEDRLVPPARGQVGTARVCRKGVTEPWWIASYSAIMTSRGAVTPAVETAAEATFQESQAEASGASTEAIGEWGQTVKPTEFPHTFPKGAEAGTFLHDLFEWAARQGFARVTRNHALLRDQVARRCQLRGWARHIEPLTEWLLDWLTVPLHVPAINGMAATSITLAQVNRAVAEMEFWLSASQVDSAPLDALVTRHTLSGESRPPIPVNRVNGLLKGFMDLVFEHEGRYYVLDYKSNALGPDAAAYTPEAMRAAILKARYDLQYVLYLLALHRHLRSRLPDYRYDNYIGGAVYVFLRGHKAPSQGLHVERPPAQLIEALDQLLSSNVTRAA